MDTCNHDPQAGRQSPMPANKYAAFSIPIKEGIIYLATRNTPPFVGLYSAIGGKLTKDNSGISFGEPSQSSMRLEEQGFERPTTAAIRELCEEVYADRRFPDDFDLEAFQAMRLGCVLDTITGVICYLRVVAVPPVEFTPSKREIGDIKALRNINPAQINPLTKLAIRLMRDQPSLGLQDQLPSLEVLAVDNTPSFPGHWRLRY